MRYVKVLILVCLFFFVMLFFVQNQAVFSTSVPLKLDLMLIPVKESMPLPIYTLLLICFLLGGILCLAMLIWDRLTLSTKATFSSMKARSLEKDLQKSANTVSDLQTKLAAAQAKTTEVEANLKTTEASLKETETKLKEALDRLSKLPGQVSFDN